MRKQKKYNMAQSLFTLAAVLAVVYMPEGHAHGSYGTPVDKACLGLVTNQEGVPNASPPAPYDGTAKYPELYDPQLPQYPGEGCLLCHVDGDRSTKKIAVEPAWTIYLTYKQSEELLAFCDQAPDSIITAPANNLTVMRGEPLSFAGYGTNTAPDPSADEPLTYAWDFGGAAAASDKQNPTVSLNTAGPITVSFTAIDSKGRKDLTPAKIVINVVDPNANQPPNGMIQAPGNDKPAKAGHVVTFLASASDPENDTPIMYKWDFGDTASSGFMADSKTTHTYDTAGIYTVTLTVKDSKGNVDPTPDTLNITVTSNTACTDHDKDSFSPDGGVCGPVDCDDHNAAINPGAPEVCSDNIDNDCNGIIDKDCQGPTCDVLLPKKDDEVESPEQDDEIDLPEEKAEKIKADHKRKMKD